MHLSIFLNSFWKHFRPSSRRLTYRILLHIYNTRKKKFPNLGLKYVPVMEGGLTLKTICKINFLLNSTLRVVGFVRDIDIPPPSENLIDNSVATFFYQFNRSYFTKINTITFVVYVFLIRRVLQPNQPNTINYPKTIPKPKETLKIRILSKTNIFNIRRINPK